MFYWCCYAVFSYSLLVKKNLPLIIQWMYYMEHGKEQMLKHKMDG